MRPSALCLSVILLLSPVPAWAEEDDKPTTDFPYTLDVRDIEDGMLTVVGKQ